MSTEQETSAPYKSERIIEAKVMSIAKQHILIPKRVLLSHASTQFVSVKYRSCDEIPNTLQYNVAKSQEIQQHIYINTATCEKQWLDKIFRPAHNRCSRKRSAPQTNRPTKKTRYQFKWKNI